MKANSPEIPEDYSEMMKTEMHHNHDIILDPHGTLRWLADPFIVQFLEDCSMNEIAIGFQMKGSDKNTESYRELYRRMGYSLSGYWEVFYWDLNNDIANDYRPPSTTQ
tara:strand:- start:34 stop:357 length:324 start_codon:yes stop_codon:yes gene_type:complete